MAISKRPEKNTSTSAQTVDVNEIINRGGTTPKESVKRVSNEKKGILLQISTQLLETIDELVSKRVLKIPRRRWFDEAILEKIERDTKE